MTTATFVANLLRQGAHLWESNGQLRYRGPKGLFTPECLSELKSRKAELLRLIGEGRRLCAATHGQQRIWFLHRLHPEHAMYTMADVAARLDGPLDPERLLDAIQTVYHRHDVLRTTFQELDGALAQVVHDDLPFAGDVRDLRSLPESQRDAEARRIAVSTMQKTFDLESGPLFRAHIVRLSEDRHLLLVPMHHIIFDGWSFALLLQDICAAYEGTLAVDADVVQYAEAAWAQEQKLDDEERNRQLTYWRQHLAGDVPPLELPTDRPRSTVQRHEGDKVFRDLPPELQRLVKEYAIKTGATTFMVYMAALMAVLHRYTKQEVIRVGIPVSGRQDPACQKTIGLFVNTVTLQVDVGAANTFEDLVAAVKRASLNGLAHQTLPFDEVVRAVQPERDLSRTPVFQALFVYQNVPLPEMRIGDAALRLYPLSSGTSKFDITLSLINLDHGAEGFIEYDTDLFDAASMTALFEHLERLLRDGIAAPQTPIAALSMEEAKTSPAIAGPTRDFGHFEPLHYRFEAHAATAPDDVAVAVEGESLTYGELNARANAIARALMGRGDTLDRPIGVCAERSPLLIAGMLGILKAGAAYVPIDPDWPVGRVADMVRNAGVTTILVDDLHNERLTDLPTMNIASMGASDEPNPVAAITPHTAAYILFTSGSTGTPKGVVVEHGTLFNYVNAVIEGLRLPPGCRYAFSSTFAADVVNTAVYPSLCTGGALHLISRETALDPAAMAAYMRSNAIDFLKAVPSHIRALMAYHTPKDLLPSKMLVLGGEALDWNLVGRIRSAAPDLRIQNHYGPTETTVAVLTREIDADTWAARPGSTAPLGVPLPNCRVYVLDESGAPVPRGLPGELYIGGAQVSRGYANDPERTAERFVTLPIAPDDRVYRTGDIVRQRHTGELEFLRRADDQVKIRGYRVELGEIASVLMSVPGVTDAAAIVREDRPGNPALIAYVVAGEHVIDPARAACAERLPSYMHPAAIVRLDALPLTANGKLDRRALPAPEIETTGSATLSTETERDLAAVWHALLGVEPRHGDDDFFALGGHSLLAMQLAARVQDRFHVELSLRDFFSRPTVAALARIVESGSRDESITLEPIADEQEPPLSFAQQRLWFVDQLNPNSPAYNLPGALRLRGPLNEVALEHAINAVIERHEPLRSAFAIEDGRPKVDILVSARVTLEKTDLSGLPSADREAAVNRAAETEAMRPFDLTKAPLLRAGLLTLEENEHVILLTLHHIAADGWSLGIFARELAEFYRAFSDDAPAQLPQLPIRYRDYAAWQRRWLQGERLEGELAHWRTVLANAPTLELPTDRPRPNAQRFRGNVAYRSAPDTLREGVAALARRHDTTPYTILLAAFATLLHRHSGETDIVIGTPVAGRSRAEFEGLIGLFVNTLVLRIDTGGEPGFDTLIQRVRETAATAFDHQDVPFEQIVQDLNPERDLSRNPIVQVTFGLQNDRDGAIRLPGLDVEPLPYAATTTRMDLELHVRDTAEGYRFMATFDTDLFDEATINRFLDQFLRVLRGIIANETAPIGKLEILSAEERETLLHTWNDTATPMPAEAVHQLFETQAAQSPTAIAVRDGRVEWTYDELNARANRVAHLLKARGIAPGGLVGVCMERSCDLLAALLGVLKAGAAYVPFDPAHPAERIAFMAEDTRIPFILTDGASRHAVPANVEALVLAEEEDALSGQSTNNPGIALAPDALAYVLYTSGSTGKPKGTLIEHRGLTNYVVWASRDYAMAEGDGALVHSPITFDLTITGLFGPLMVGKTVVFLAEEGVDAVGEALRAESNLAVVKITPAHLELLGHQIPKAEAAGRTNAFIIGGENLTADHIDFWCANAPGTRLVNEYGPTETVVGCAIYTVGPDETVRGSVPIGKPIANTRLYVLDAYGEPVPVGVPGELFIGGAGVARGYLNRPELTSERFLRDSFARGSDARMYRTGDVVKYLPDGNLLFLGRADDQVKVRGYRIELGEIETAMGSWPYVKDAVVAVREDTPGDKRLVGYVVLDNPPSSWESEIRDRLRATLPPYMTPNVFMAIESVPLSPNGKVDRKALPKPAGERLAEQTFVAPTSETETQLAAIWAEIIGIDQVGIEDDFFTLGGHSLLATQVMARVHDAFGADLPLRTFFESRTVAALAQHVDSARGKHRAAIPAVPRDADLPASFPQQRLWFLHQLAPGATAYNIPMAVRLEGLVSVDALRTAFSALVERHEILRTTLHEGPDGPLQRIATPFTVDIHTEPCDALTDERIAAAGNAVARTAFNPESLPLFRVQLLSESPERHALVVCFHHSIFDGWSTTVLERDLAEAYAAAVEGHAPEWAPLTVQYADYASWQRTWLREHVFDDQAAFWKDELANVPQLELPTDRPRPTVQQFNGGRVVRSLAPDLADALPRLARAEDATLFMVMLAGFSILLNRHTGQEDVAVASPVANRNRSELEDLIGFFVNTQVLRTRQEGDPTFAEFVARVRETCLKAYENQDLPFEYLVELLQPERDLSRNPLVQVALVVQNTPPSRFRLGAVQGTPVDFESDNTRFDLEVHVRDDGDGLRCYAFYDRDLFDQGRIERMLAQYETLLAAIVRDPGALIHDYDILPGAERAQVIEAFNATKTDYDRATLAPIHIARHATERPNHPAIVCGNDTLTFAELDERANRLAQRLRKLGVDHDVPVALCFERGPWLAISALAVLKAGGAYLPIDPEYPEERVRYMLENSAAALVLTDTARRDRVACASIPVIALNEEWTSIATEPAESPAPTATPESLAYIIYTSGSTGRPKGVAVEHRALLNLVHWHNRAFDVTSGDRATWLAGVGFDASVWELWPHLVAGATLIAPDDETRMSPDLLKPWLAEHNVTVSFLPTPLAEACMAGDWPEASLRVLLTGGDRLRNAPQAPLPFTLVNNYGPTENAVVTTSAPVAPGHTPPPIGGPIDNNRVYIVDARGRVTPMGVPGELLIGGESLARGYVNDDAQTSERFVPPPFAGCPDTRLYRTGDIVRFRDDGAIDFAGRADDQIKIRGFRIELGEIENVVTNASGVKDAAVLARDDMGPGLRLVAYVTTEPGAENIDQIVIAHARKHLPDYMTPHAIVPLEAFPLNASGKIDRKALPKPDALADGSAPGTLPESPTELRLADIWKDLLTLDAIGVNDDFFDAGGHSLLATQLVTRMRQEFGIGIDLRTFFDNRTIASLAQRIEGAAHVDAPPIEPAPRAELMPTSFAQQRLWFIDRLAPGNHAYNIPMAVRLTGSLDADALERSFADIVSRHEALRTTFDSVDGTSMQRIHDAIPFRLERRTLDGETEAAARKAAEEESLKPFDLATGPLIRAQLVQLAEEDHLLLVTIHHIVADGWSMGVLLRELSTLYAYHRGVRTETLPDLPIQYADFAVWQRNWLQGAVLDRQLGYWKAQLADLPALELPTDRPRPAVQGFRGAREERVLPKELANAIAALGQSEGATLFMTLLAVFDALLQRCSGQDDIVVGSPIANRNVKEIESLIGFFVNTQVLRCDLSGDPTFHELLGRVRNTTIEAFDHQDLPFEQLVEELNPERDMSRNPLVQVVLAVQNAPMEDIGLEGVVARRQAFENRSTRLDLELHVWNRADGLHCVIFYDTDLFDRARVARMLGHWEALLTGVAADPHRPISTYDILTPEESRQLLVEFNQTARTYPADVLVPLEVERRAAEFPDANAIVDAAGETMSYADLNRRANQLAHRLRALEMGPGSIVALCMERSPALVTAELAVMKTGAAYLPIDTAYPKDRIRFMIEDARAGITLTDSTGTPALPDGIEAFNLDDERESLTREPDTNLDIPIAPDSLAYVIYTSGSTGQPKGVAIEHRALLNLVHWHREAFGVTNSDRATLLAGVAFDASVWETWPYLTAGAALHIPEGSLRANPAELQAWLLERAITVAFLPTPLTEATLGLPWPHDTPLRHILTGGDLLRKRPPVDAPFSLINNYGPTENTVVATSGPVAPEGNGLPNIGRAIANNAIYILDAAMRPAPIGVPGELCIAGNSLARGYLYRDALTADRFVTIELDGDSIRVYRTGDKAAFREDGTIDFLGRLDDQVKVRGYRIELGEIESALRHHPAVKDAVVSAIDDGFGGKRLVGYVVQDPTYRPDEEGDEAESSFVEHWQTLYDSTYGQGTAGKDPTVNIIGWNSSYTGRPIPEEEMYEWVDQTTARILEQGPNNVLEIGCGTGMLLFRVAPKCNSYEAWDFSEQAIAHIQRSLDAGYGSKNVTLRQRLADNFEGVTANQYDAVVLNSIIQYFPTIHYLLEVLDNAIEAVQPGGFIYVGDVRSLPMLETYATSVQLFQADDDTEKAVLDERIRKHIAHEEELVIDPAFFHALKARHPKVSHVEIQPKRGSAHNELTRFRYEVVIHLEKDGAETDTLPWLEWHGDLNAIEQRLKQGAPEPLAVRRVPNARLGLEMEALAWLHGADGARTKDEFLHHSAPRGVEPDALRALGESLGYRVMLDWSNPTTSGYFDAIFIKDNHKRPVDIVGRPATQPRWDDLANSPMQGSFARKLAPVLRQALGETLPDYMVPSAFVVLPDIPVTPNGKVDRKALPKPEGGPAAPTLGHTAPRNDAEERVAALWREVLGVKQPSVHDNFFDSGGNSLLLVELLTHVNSDFGGDLTLQDVFQAPTITDIAAKLVGGDGETPGDELPEGASPLLVPLRIGTGKTNLFCVAPAGGTVFPYYAMTHSLDADQTVYALQDPSFAAKSEPCATIEEMAREYVAAIKSVQPEGPYYVLGWSFGGFAALEIAQQLIAAGDEVKLLGVIEAPVPERTARGVAGATRDWLTTVKFTLAHLGSGLKIIRDGLYIQTTKLAERGAASGSLMGRFKAFWARLAWSSFLRQADVANVMSEESRFTLIEQPATREFLKISSANMRAFERYDIAAYPGPIAVFRAELQPGSRSAQDPAHGWRAVAKAGVQLHPIEGDHFSIMRTPNVRQVARILQDYLKP